MHLYHVFGALLACVAMVSAHTISVDQLAMEAPSFIDPAALQTILCNQYENAIDQIMETAAHDFLASVPQSLMAFRLYQYTGRERNTCRPTTLGVVHILNDHLPSIKNQLTSAVCPMVEETLCLGDCKSRVAVDVLPQTLFSLNRKLSDRLSLMLITSSLPTQAATLSVSPECKSLSAKSVSRFVKHARHRSRPELYRQIDEQDEITKWISAWLKDLSTTVLPELDQRLARTLPSIVRDAATHR